MSARQLLRSVGGTWAGYVADFASPFEQTLDFWLQWQACLPPRLSEAQLVWPASVLPAEMPLKTPKLSSIVQVLFPWETRLGKAEQHWGDDPGPR